MGHYVHIHVCFACDTNEGVAAIARRHLASVPEGCREERWFLADLSERTGSNQGPKGGLSLWGLVGNYTNEDKFVEVLKPFWLEVLSGNVEGGPCSHERILVFSEHEQSERTQAHEIYAAEGELVIKKHGCPFQFAQF